MLLSLGYSTLVEKYRNNETLTILAPISASFFSPLHFIFFCKFSTKLPREENYETGPCFASAGMRWEAVL